MSIDEELTRLEDGIRRLKIEYEIFFNGGAKRLPHDLRWRVEALIKKYGDNSQMTFAQRFRYNALSAKFHTYSDLWRRTLRSKEEGRPPFVTVASNGSVVSDQSAEGDRLICQLVCTDPESEDEKIANLFKSLVEAKRECGERPDSVQFQSFRRLMVEKTQKLKEHFHTGSVCYTISIESGKVKLTAKART